jgi:hypothetical protein
VRNKELLDEAARKLTLRYINQELEKPNALRELISANLYGDSVKWSDRSIWYKVKWRSEQITHRISDAWRVLIGRAHVDDSY